MLLSATQNLTALQKEFAKLALNVPDSNQAGSPTQVINACLEILFQRERQGISFIERQEVRLRQALGEVLKLLKSEAYSTSELLLPIVELKEQLYLHNTQRNLATREEQWRGKLKLLERALIKLGDIHNLSQSTRTGMIEILGQWESIDLKAHMSENERGDRKFDQNKSIDIDQWQLYLQRRFEDPSLAITEFKPLSGGFGKETIFFRAAGDSLVGDFVLRRDYPVDVMDNDCHTVAREYTVISAVCEAGFPAPDVVWLDTQHLDIPGGDFMVMRRSPGETGGTVFDSHERVSALIANTLASSCAHLHTLPELNTLEDLTSSICHDSWQSTTTEVVQKYIAEWYHMYISNPHIPSPALVTLYGWLLDNIPANKEKPVLLHGDIGFHNMVLIDGDLSCLVDWEYAHMGDPAEDMAYIKNTAGHVLDWEAFIALYTEKSGFTIDTERLRFFQIWGHVRNATSANMASALFTEGRVDELKFAILPFTYITRFIDEAQQLIRQ